LDLGEGLLLFGRGKLLMEFGILAELVLVPINGEVGPGKFKGAPFGDSKKVGV